MIKPSPNKLPSNKDNTQEEHKFNESSVRNIINSGGSPALKISRVGEGTIKNISIKFLAEEGEMINRLRNARPKIRNKKITISLHDWFIEAMQEKIEREKQLYGIN